MGRLLTALAFLVAVGMAAALLIPPFVNWESLRPVFVKEASARLGQPVTVSGPISLQILPSPKLSASDVSVGSDKSAYRLRADSIDADLGFSALLGSDTDVTGVTLHNPKISILSGNAVNTLTGEWARSGLETLTVVDGVIERGALPIVRNIDVEIVEDARGYRLSGSADIESVTWDVTGKLGQPETEALQPFRLRLFDKVSELDVLLAGQGTATPAGVNATGSLTMRGQSVGKSVDALVSLFRFEPLEINRKSIFWTRPLSVTADLQMTPQGVRASGLSLDVAEARFEGDALMTLSDTPRVNIDLTAQTFPVDKIFGADFPPPSARDIWRLAAPYPVHGTFDEDLRGLVSIKIASLLWKDTVIQDLAVSAALSDGIAGLRGLSMTLPGGARAGFDLSPAAGQSGAAVSGAINVSADHPRTFFEWLGLPVEHIAHGVVTRFDLQAGLMLDAESARLDDVSLNFGEANATGRVHLPVPGVAASHVDVEFIVQKLNLDGFRGLASAEVGGAAMAQVRDLLGEDATGSIRLTARDMTFAGTPISAGLLKLELRDGLARIDEAYVSDFAGIDFSGRGTLPLTAMDPAGDTEHRVEIRIEGEEPGKFVEAFGLTDWFPAEGIPPIGMDVNLKLEADSSEFVALGMAGRTDLSVLGKMGRARPQPGEDGTVRSGTIPAWRVSLQASNPDGAALAYQLGLTDKPETAAAKGGELQIDIATEDGRGPVKIALTSSALSLNLAGTLDWQERFERFAGFMTFEAPKAQTLRQIEWMTGPLTLKGEIEASRTMVAVSEVSGTIAEALMDGALNVDLSGDKPRISGRLGVDALDIRSMTAVSELSKPSKPTDLPPWSTQLFSSGWFEAVEGTIEVDASMLSFGTTMAQDIGARVELWSDGLKIRGLTAAAFGGQIKGTIDLLPHPSGMAFEVDLNGERVELSELGSLLSAPLGGSSTVSLKVTGQGATVFDMVSSLSGAMALKTPQGHFGRIDTATFADGWPMLETLGAFNNLVKASSGEDAKTPFMDLTGRILIKDGIMTFENFTGQTPGGPMTLQGQIDLPGYIVDLTANFPVAPNTVPLQWTLSGSMSAPDQDVNAADLRLAFARRIRDTNAGRITEDNLPKEIQELLKILDELESDGEPDTAQ